MKINVALILLGVILLFAAYLIFQISIPWIGFTPLPTIVTVNPFEPLAFLLAAVGFIALVFGLTQNIAIRITITLAAILFIIALFKGWISLDMLRKIFLTVATATC